MAVRSIARLSHCLQRKGQVNVPGITYASQKTVEELLLEDAKRHHCYFRSAGLHNHLSHHLLAAYDLGATSAHLKRIFAQEAPSQRPIFVEKGDSAIVVTDDNWARYLGNQSAYGAFVEFFSAKVADLGVHKALEVYIFEEDANKDGRLMLVRLVSGAVHPFIQVGYGLEFGDNVLVATGLSQAAIHSPTGPNLFNFSSTAAHSNSAAMPGLTVLEVLREVYDCDVIHPKMPYDPNALFNARLEHIFQPASAEAIRGICSRYYINQDAIEAQGDEYWAKKAEEFVWIGTLLMCGTGKEGKKPRLDFFLMHLVTSSIFLRPFLSTLANPIHKANLLRAYLTVVILMTLARGRPRINPALLMGYTAAPRPPIQLASHPKTILGQLEQDEEYNPWMAMIGDAVYHPDSHVLKAMRTLVFAAKEYGITGPGGAIGAFRTQMGGVEQGQETHAGTATMDGTIFARAAGMVLDYMGWVGHGQEARDDWDRSALGWDAAWDNEQ